MFGSKSEKSDPDQYQLALEDIEAAMAEVRAEDDAVDPPKIIPTKLFMDETTVSVLDPGQGKVKKG